MSRTFELILGEDVLERVWALTPSQLSILEQRLAEADAAPDDDETWESIRAEILAERGPRTLNEGGAT